MSKDVTELVDRNIPAFKGKGRFLLAGYPKFDKKRIFRNANNCIYYRVIALRMRKRLEDIFKKFTPEEIIEKINQARSKANAGNQAQANNVLG